MPFVATIAHTSRRPLVTTSGGDFDPVTKAATVDFSDITVPIKNHITAHSTTTTSSLRTTAYGDYDEACGHDSLAALAPLGLEGLRYDGIANVLPRLGSIAGIDARVLLESCAHEYNVGGGSDESEDDEGADEAAATVSVAAPHPHCGLSWAVEVAGAAPNKEPSPMGQSLSDNANVATTAAGGGTPVASFLEGAKAPNANATVAAPNKAIPRPNAEETAGPASALMAAAAAAASHHHHNEEEEAITQPNATAAHVVQTAAAPFTAPSGLEAYADRHLYPFVTFLRQHAGLAHLLLKSARRSKFLSRNADTRFIALLLLQQHVTALSGGEAGAGGGGGVIGGARHQSVMVAAALFIAAKFCDQNAQVRHVLCETGLAAYGGAKPRDVFDTEFAMLAACGFHVQIPRYWQSACEVALSAPHPGHGGLRAGGGCGIAPQTRLRIHHTAMFMDRQLVTLSRSAALQLAVLQMNADELALGCSIAVAASMATPTEATVALFDSVVVAPLNINFQTLQAEALHEYVKCLGHLASVLVAEAATPPVA